MNSRPTFTIDHRDRPGDERRPTPAYASPQPRRTLRSADIFLGEHEVGIDHGGALYRLKITRQGKLILNK